MGNIGLPEQLFCPHCGVGTLWTHGALDAVLCEVRSCAGCGSQLHDSTRLDLYHRARALVEYGPLHGPECPAGSGYARLAGYAGCFCGAVTQHKTAAFLVELVEAEFARTKFPQQ